MLWSLAVEEQFYLVWPLIVLAPRRIAMWAAGGLMIAAPLLRAICTPLFHNQMPIYYLTPFRMDLLACGALICFILRTHPERVRSCSGIAQGALAAVGVALPILARFAGMRTGPNTVGSNVVVFELALIIAAATLILALDHGSWLARILKTNCLRAIGKISYSMYLIHLTLLMVCQEHLRNEFVIIIAAFSGTLLYSALSWHFIENRLLGNSGPDVSWPHLKGMLRLSPTAAG